MLQRRTTSRTRVACLGLGLGVPLILGCAALAPRGPVKGPFLKLSNGQPAAYVIGQSSLTASETGNERLMWNMCAPAFLDGMLIIPDTWAHRFWVFRNVPQADVAVPDAVIGQASLSDGSLGPRPFQHPSGIQKYRNRYYVSTDEGVISIWDTLPIGAHTYDGRPLITTGLPRTVSMSIVGGKLVLSSGFRILIWNRVPTASTTADTADITITGAGAGGAKFNGNNQHWTDGSRLVVVDRGNHRVLLWTTFPRSNEDPADFVLGQPDMACPEHGCIAGTSATKMDGPSAVTSNGIQIFVADAANKRILVWNSFPTANNAPADVVLGQADFTGNLPQRGGIGNTAETLGEVHGLGFGDGKLFAGDSYTTPDGVSSYRWLAFTSQ